MSEARRPRPVLKVGGKYCSILGYTVENNTNFQADTFSVTLECWQQKDGFGLEFWASAGTTNIEILLGFLEAGQDVAAVPSSPLSLIIGQVDDISSDVATGSLIITGRDQTALLIDNKTTTTWPDQTASQIVTTIAGLVGLTPQVTATKTPVGKYSKSAYSAVARETPYWDLVTTYAQQEGFDAYVTGNTLYFGPPQADTDPNPYKITVARDVTTKGVSCSAKSLKLKRSLTLAKDITVTVIGHSLKSGKPVKEIATRQGVKTTKTSSSKSQPAQNYVINRPNLTPQQALQLAQKTLDDLSRHERTFEATNWDDGTLTARRKARVSGTGTDFDQDYWLDKVTHTYSFGELGLSISGKNHPVETALAQ